MTELVADPLGASRPLGPGDVAPERLLAACGGLRRRARRLVGSPFDVALTSAEIELVRHVRRHPECAVAEAAAALGVAANTVSTLVRKLTDAGVLLRLADPSDRRVVRLALTPEAAHRLSGWRDSRSVALAAGIARLSVPEREALARAVPVLEALADDLQTYGRATDCHDGNDNDNDDNDNDNHDNRNDNDNDDGGSA